MIGVDIDLSINKQQTLRQVDEGLLSEVSKDSSLFVLYSCA
jgi:hypothetical protein